ncbi:DUF4397 domain-containing protein [Demequina sp. TTPB684]|uniref:DUF4397 domain-containing protein n=1 Tax=unclassified Demequina TaxID=2620311 RepID=UPI001CF1468B|nr:MULTISPECIES: DUF4397 domain-containing protein [unclassified Demequina]MCB2413013.1 DUF4397 domain-containing protein [Demequina sp. TTPB684]UPU87082.1 DUF4397 domain-containing protein [Demequina sp. TMPB413]
MKKSVIGGLAAGIMLAVGSGASAVAVEDGKSDLAVLHGIPGLTVDVYVNNALTLDDFAPGDLAGPLSLDPGDYEVAITASDAADASSPVLGPITISLAANMSYTAVAHLDASGDPTVGLFTNDNSATAAGEGRLTVRHVAAAPAVDILADGAAVFTGLENPDEVMADLPVGTYSAAVALEGTTDPVIGPAPVTLTEGVNTIVYAWGSAGDGSLALAVQNVDTMMNAPGGVFAGSAPLSGSQNDLPVGLIVLAGLALVGAGIAGRAVVISRR